MDQNREEHIVKQDAVNQYLKTIAHHLCCTDKKKKEIVKELESDIRIAMENGESWEEIQKRMGTPEEIAEEFNENFSENELKTNKRKNAAGIVGILGIVILVVCVVVVLITGHNSNADKSDSKQDAGKSGQVEKEIDASTEDETFSTENASQNQVVVNPEQDTVTTHSDYDEAAVIEHAKTIISLVDAGDFETLRNEYPAQIMQSSMEQAQMEEAKKMICEDWGEFLSYGNFYTSGVEQEGEKYVVVQVNVSYENTNVTFTISLDGEMKMVGIYMM